MALSFLDASLILACAPRLAHGGDVLMLGRQANVLTDDDLTVLNQRYGQALLGLDSASQPWSEPLFQRLGATNIESLDYSNYEGAALIHDMNAPWPDGAPPRQYDLVYDGGTLEHVFNLPQALLNAMQLVKVGGYFIGASPCDGWLGHGFHQLQPELFFRVFTAERGFKLHGVWLGEFGTPPARARLFKLVDPAIAGCRNQVPGKRPLVILVCAERIASPSTVPSWPGQSNYTTMWQQAEAGTEMPRTHFLATLKQRLTQCVPSLIRRPLQRWLIARKHARMARSSWQEVKTLHVSPH